MGIKHLMPFLKSTVAGDDDGTRLVTLRQDLVKILDRSGCQSLQTEVIQHQQIAMDHTGHHPRISAFGAGNLQFVQ